MHHARAQEPVIVGVVQAERVGTVPQVTPVELSGHTAGDRQVKGGDLLGHRGERSLQEAIVCWHWTIPSGEQTPGGPGSGVVRDRGATAGGYGACGLYLKLRQVLVKAIAVMPIISIHRVPG